MNYVHEKTGKDFDIGYLMDSNGKTFDMSVILKWDYENDYAEDPVIIDYYFGEFEDDVTDYCIDEFIKRQKGLKTALKFLNLIDQETMEAEELEELKESIKVLKEITTDLV
jgi:hypothetical protein